MEETVNIVSEAEKAYVVNVSALEKWKKVSKITSSRTLKRQGTIDAC
jgi:hypothetical protein